MKRQYKKKSKGEIEMNKSKKYSVIGWNINQRSGVGGVGIPKFVAEEIKDQNADIVVLTEFYFCKNADAFLKETFVDRGFSYSTTRNRNTNEVVVAWRDSCFTEVGVDRAVTTKDNNVPNFLRVDLEGLDGEITSVIGTRVRIVEYERRQEALRFILAKAHGSNPIIMIGDFNNCRRETTVPEWSLQVIDSILAESGFLRYTPKGQSIYEEVSSRGYAYEFAEDHIMVRGMQVEIEDYDREFVHRATREQYPWGKNFQSGNHQQKIRPGFPDHAIVKGFIERKVG